MEELKPAAKRERLRGFDWGELGKLVSGLVRGAQAPFTGQEIADLVVQKKPNYSFTKVELTKVSARVHSALKRLEEGGLIQA